MRKAISFLSFFLFSFLFPLFIFGQVKFIENKGQWDDPVLYRADISGGRAFITPNAIRYNFIDKKQLHELHDKVFDADSLVINTHAVFIEFVNANPQPEFTHNNPFPEYYNYFLSSNPSRWKSGVNAYGKLYAKEIFPATDLEIESEDAAIKYTYYLKPGAEPSKILMRIQGADKLQLKEKELHIYTSVNHIVEQKPYAYQLIGEEKREIKCEFYLEKGNYVGFRFPDGYDKNLPLVIDPTVIFATYSGSLGDNFGFTATYDTAGNGYSGGTVYDIGFPATSGAFQKVYKDGVFGKFTIADLPRDAGILKYSPDGKNLLYATYLGGTNNEEPHSMVVDSQNNLVVFGTTFSTDFPHTKTAFDTSYNDSGDVFITKLSADGKTLMASTFVGGTNADGLNGIRTSQSKINRPLAFNYGDQYRGEVISDKFNNIYVATCTMSKNFPVTTGAAQTTFGQGTQDGCVFKLNSNFSKLTWSNFIGGSKYDAAYSLQLDQSQNVFVCGGTVSPYFFKDKITYQDTLIGDSADAFICKIRNDGNLILEATYFGTDKYDQAYFIQLDPEENVYVFGQTTSSNFLVRSAKYYNAKSGQFIAKFSNNLRSNLLSSVFGSGSGRPNISPGAFLVDNCGKIYVSGWGGQVNIDHGHGGSTFNMPVTNDAFKKKTDGSDFYVAVYARDMDTLLYASFFGGDTSQEHVDGGTSRFDKRGVIYQSVCGGCQTSNSPIPHSDFPATPGAWSRLNMSDNCNNLLFKVDLDMPDLKAKFSIPPKGCAPFTIKPIDSSLRAVSYFWDFGDGTTSTLKNPSKTYTTAGKFKIKLVVSNLLSCKEKDTTTREIFIYNQAKAGISLKDNCAGIIKFDTIKTLANNFLWLFGDGNTSTLASPTHNYQDTGTFIITLVADPGTPCVDSVRKELKLYKPNFAFSAVDTCSRSFQITGVSSLDSNFLWIINKDTLRNTLPKYVFPAVGNFQVKLIVNKANGCKDSVTKTVNVPAPLKPKFTYIIDTCRRQLTFSSDMGGDSDLTWIIEGDTLRQKNPTYTFPAIGNYTVKLALKKDVGCLDTAIQTVSVPAPVPGFHSFNYSIDTCARKLQFFINSLKDSNLTWIALGDTFNQYSPIIAFPDIGKYEVKLLVKKKNGCVDTVIQSVNIPAPLKSDFTYIIDTCNRKIAFFRIGSPKDTNLVWIIENDTTYKYTPSHTFPAPGSYKVTLISRKSTGCIDTITKTVILPAPPKSDFIYKIDTCSRLVTFLGSTVKDSNRTWIFGKDTLRQYAPTYLFPSIGSYNITYIVKKKNGCIDTVKKTIIIPAPAKADFSFSIDSCTKTISVNLLSAQVKKIIWKFGDGTQDTSLKPKPHFYSQLGTYAVTLIINPGLPCQDSIQKRIDLKRTSGNFNYLYDTCTGIVLFNNQSPRNIKSYLWLLEEGKTDTSFAPKYIYKKAGIHEVKLITNPNSVCADTIIKQVITNDLSNPESLMIPNILTINGDGYNEEFRVTGFNFNCQEFELFIFNRWGQMLFHEKGRDLVWKGTTPDGDFVPAGVYYYILKSNVINIRQGTITIIH